MASSGERRLIMGGITQSKLKGKALIDALGAMTKPVSINKKKNVVPKKK